MKILLITGNYLPGKNGGIENYTHWLATILLQHHYEVEVAALNVKEDSDYIYDKVKVNNLKGSFSAFESVLKSGAFDICHFHEYSEFGGIEIPWFAKAKEHTKKVYFTFHLPYLTCYKKDFRYKGLEDCNTFSDSKRCTECVIADKISYKKIWYSQLYLSSALALMKMTGDKKKLERRILSKYQKLKELIETCDEIFIYGKWFKRILMENGYDSPKLKEIPHITKITHKRIERVLDGVKRRILFVGRIEKQKGLHLLCRAMNLIQSENIELDVFGNIVDENYYKRCKKIFDFNYYGSVPRSELLQKFHDYDFLVLPSVFTEMYSLVLKEAFYEDLPVIVSTAKGNKDAVRDGENGFLFDYDNAEDLATTIDEAYQLKKNGWMPAFSYPENPQKDNDEIVSYYL